MLIVAKIVLVRRLRKMSIGTRFWWIIFLYLLGLQVLVVFTIVMLMHCFEHPSKILAWSLLHSFDRYKWRGDSNEEILSMRDNQFLNNFWKKYQGQTNGQNHERILYNVCLKRERSTAVCWKSIIEAVNC